MSKKNNYYGLKNYYNYYKNRYKTAVDEKTFSKVVKDIHKEFLHQLETADTVELPCDMGYLSIKIKKAKAWFDENNKIIVDRPINWLKTLKLWDNDEEAKKTKKVIRSDSPFKIRTIYRKGKAKFKYMNFYAFEITDDNKAELYRKINEEEVHLIYYD